MSAHDSGPADAASDPDEVLDFVLARYIEAHEADGAADREAWIDTQPALASGGSLRAAFRQRYEAYLRAKSALEQLGCPDEPSSGQLLGDFCLVKILGRGGMGVVWLAEQLSVQRAVALKLVRPARVDRRSLALFAREARAGGRLCHPGLVQVHCHGQVGGTAWIAMELVPEATTLEELLARVRSEPTVPPGHDGRMAMLVAEIADAMQAAHAAGVIHRDLKPANVLLTREGRPKVTDFGLARLVDESGLSESGVAAGTYPYMSPEQLTAKRGDIGPQSDVFSLGVVLYEILTLRKPFVGDVGIQIAEQILSRDPEDPRAIRSRIPRDLAVITNKALAKDRRNRYPSMAEFAEDLRRHLRHEPIHAHPPTCGERAAKWAIRHPTITIAGTIAAVAVAVIARSRSVVAAANVALEQSNAALKTKTTEAERMAELATQRADDVLRLSALQELEDLIAEADRLWPADADNLPKYEDWLKRAEALVRDLPEHERKLAELRSKAQPGSEKEPEAQRARNPRLEELERIRRHLAYLQCATSSEEVSAAALGIDWSALPDDPIALADVAWPLVVPEREDWGGEARGLAIARRAMQLASNLPVLERLSVRQTLVWALFANGRFDEALREHELVGNETPALHKEEEATARLVAELRAHAAKLEGETVQRAEWRFGNPQDKWWHNQLAKLVEGLRALADPSTGLLSEGTSEEHGWGIRKREAVAGSVLERSTDGPEAAAKWRDAIASIRDPEQCPLYRGLELRPQLGLVPLGRDPRSGLWEFGHLETGEPAERVDGELVLKEETGIVFVLLPGGTFWMGAQRGTDQNHDPQARTNEGPPNEVTLSAFLLSKYEMTQAQWERFAGRNPSTYSRTTYFAGWNADSKPWTGLHPVEQVSWLDCMQLLSRLGLTLPSEAQWEYGARAGTSTVWWCGDEKEGLEESPISPTDMRAKTAGVDGAVSKRGWRTGMPSTLRLACTRRTPSDSTMSTATSGNGAWTATTRTTSYAMKPRTQCFCPSIRPSASSVGGASATPLRTRAAPAAPMWHHCIRSISSAFDPLGL